MATDTASMDYGQSSDFEVHQILGEANIWAVENLANAEALPETGMKQDPIPLHQTHQTKLF